MKQIKVKQKIEDLYSQTDDLLRDNGVDCDSALYGLLTAAIFALKIAVLHVYEYNENYLNYKSNETD